MDKSDSQLMMDIARGNAAAFADFYSRHASRVFGLVQRMVGTQSDADDVLQETFWQVWNRADRFDTRRGTPLVWLLLLARSRARDALRRRRPSADIAVAASLMLDSDPSGPAVRDESARRLREAMKRIPGEQRTAIEMAFFEGMTHEEVAQRLGLALGTVKTRIRLGMRRLRGLLDGLANENTPS
jgi:RNA polymerase sigma-70 factor (ECF subfamily)